MLMCKAHLPILSVPSTYSVAQPPHFVAKGWEWKAGKVEGDGGRYSGAEHGAEKPKVPLESS